MPPRSTHEEKTQEFITELQTDSESDIEIERIPRYVYLHQKY